MIELPAMLKKRTSEKKRSPLKAAPLRSAAQSLDERIHALISEDIGSYATMLGISFMIVIYEWLHWYFKSPPHPVWITCIMMPFALYSAIKIRSIRLQLRRLRQARDGEKAVGQYLESLREKGYRVFHDILGKDFNIDHVLIGPAGAFSIETKTISKPVRGSCEIEYDGENVRVNGFQPDRDPIVQAKAEAAWLREFIEESTGMRVKIRPVVLYPGWYITGQPRGAEVWVLNPKSLPGFLDHCGTNLAPDEIRMIAKHISRFQRAGGDGGSCSCVV
jgi:hypothetical protein